MKGVAEPFDLAKVDVYKALQRTMASGAVPVMEREAEDGASGGDTTSTVFGTDRSELRRLGTVCREVHVALLDFRSDALSVPGDHPAFRDAVGLRRLGRRHLVLAAPTPRRSARVTCTELP